MRNANARTIHWVIGSLAIMALGSLVGIVALAMAERSVPDVLQNVTVGAMAALAGLLAKTHVEEEGPQAATDVAQPDVRLSPNWPYGTTTDAGSDHEG